MHIKQSVFKLPQIWRRPIIEIISGLEILVWKANRKAVPFPHKEKMKVLLKYINEYRPNTFVETGTYLGQTVDVLKNKFENVYSIELDKMLYQNAKKLFSKDKHVKIFQGDSAIVLNNILDILKSPTLFWLDAHYSGGITSRGPKDTPILKELNIISKKMFQKSVILIDDAREFDGHGDYSKIEIIKKFVSKKFPKFKMTVKQDIIRIYPE